MQNGSRTPTPTVAPPRIGNRSQCRATAPSRRRACRTARSTHSPPLQEALLLRALLLELFRRIRRHRRRRRRPPLFRLVKRRALSTAQPTLAPCSSALAATTFAASTTSRRSARGGATFGRAWLPLALHAPGAHPHPPLRKVANIAIHCNTLGSRRIHSIQLGAIARLLGGHPRARARHHATGPARSDAQIPPQPQQQRQQSPTAADMPPARRVLTVKYGRYAVQCSMTHPVGGRGAPDGL